MNQISLGQEATDVWQAREQVDGQGDSSLAPVAYQELDSSLLGCVLRWLLP